MKWIWLMIGMTVNQEQTSFTACQDGDLNCRDGMEYIERDTTRHDLKADAEHNLEIEQFFHPLALYRLDSMQVQDWAHGMIPPWTLDDLPEWSPDSMSNAQVVDSTELLDFKAWELLRPEHLQFRGRGGGRGDPQPLMIEEISRKKARRIDRLNRKLRRLR